MAPFVARSLVAGLLLLAAPAAAEWDHTRGTPDPYTQAVMMSKRAQSDPEAVKNDPDYFKKMFGALGGEMGQAKALEQAKTDVTRRDVCIACHGAVVEVEKALAERHQSNKRDPSEVAEVLDFICRMERYHVIDPMKATPTQPVKYGGLSPYIFVNACKKAVEDWNESDVVEDELIAGGPPGGLFSSLRERVCERRGGLCDGEDVALDAHGDQLKLRGQDEQCKAEAAGGDAAKTSSKAKAKPKKKARSRKAGARS